MKHWPEPLRREGDGGYDQVLLLPANEWPPKTGGSMTRINEADLVVLDDGTVKKDRYGAVEDWDPTVVLGLVEGRLMAEQANLTWRLARFVERPEAAVGISFGSKGDWMVELLWGKEAEDSPMTGAAAYGVNAELDKALTQALDEANAA